MKSLQARLASVRRTPTPEPVDRDCRPRAGNDPRERSPGRRRSSCRRPSPSTRIWSRTRPGPIRWTTRHREPPPSTAAGSAGRRVARPAITTNPQRGTLRLPRPVATPSASRPRRRPHAGDAPVAGDCRERLRPWPVGRQSPDLRQQHRSRGAGHRRGRRLRRVRQGPRSVPAGRFPTSPRGRCSQEPQDAAPEVRRERGPSPRPRRTRSSAPRRGGERPAPARHHPRAILERAGSGSDHRRLDRRRNRRGPGPARSDPLPAAEAPAPSTTTANLTPVTPTMREAAEALRRLRPLRLARGRVGAARGGARPRCPGVSGTRASGAAVRHRPP